MRRPGTGAGSSLLEVDFLLDDVERALLDLLVDTPDVLAEDTETDELHAADEQDGRESRRPAWYRGLGKKVLADEAVDHEEETDAGAHEAERGGHLQRYLGERENSVDGEPHHFFDGILGFTGEAFLTLERDVALRETDPADHAAYEAGLLAH